MRRLSFAASIAAYMGIPAFLAVPRLGRAEGLAPDAIFARAKLAWRTRVDVPFVRFGLRERYLWRDRTHDNWWQATYRQADRALAMRRTIVAEQEDARMRGVPIALNLRFHNGLAHADSLDTNPNADAFPILDPQIEPNASFGLLLKDPKIALIGGSPTAAQRFAQTPAPSPTPSQSPSPAPTPLRELIRVEAVARDYTIALAGIEHVRDADAYHLTLVPLRDPHVYRLRDLWIDTTSFVTLQIALAGLFEGAPYDDARWIVTYVEVEGRNYIQQIRTDEQLRFGMDRFVSGLQFDFVQYQFPPDVPGITFERYL
jgi:hypothetical protein